MDDLGKFTTLESNKSLLQMFHALEGLATITDVELLAEEIPGYSAHRIDEHLEQAQVILTQFTACWQKRKVARSS